MKCFGDTSARLKIAIALVNYESHEFSTTALHGSCVWTHADVLLSVEESVSSWEDDPSDVSFSIFS